MKKLILTLSLVIFSVSARAAAPKTLVAAKAEKLQELVGEVARNDQYKVKPGSALTMVKGYIAAKYKDDTDLSEAYDYVENSKTLAIDTQIAGTVSLQTAIANFGGEGWTAKQTKYAESLLREIAAAGGSFGFDGFEQNACAAPTPFLLVIDPKGGQVFGIDLSPCQE